MEPSRPSSFLFRRRQASGLGPYLPPPPPRTRWGLHIGLFVATFASMVVAGAFYVGRGVGVTPEGAWVFDWPLFWDDGVRYAVPFILFLTVHEFGHYLTARRYRMSVSLPYFLPVPLPGTLGTVGAVIRIREPFRSLQRLFDVGAGGPLAGAVVAFAVVGIAIATLPPPAYLADVPGHGEIAATLARTGTFPPLDTSSGAVDGVILGDTPLFHLLNGLGAYRVPGHELMHYPLLLAGWLGLFFTALNLLPVGQLDGGHIVYAMFGPRVHAVVARIVVLLLILSAAVGAVHGTASVLGLSGWQAWGAMAVMVSVAVAKLFEGDWRLAAPASVAVVALVVLIERLTPDLAGAVGFSGWMLWVALILFVIGVDHPPVPRTEPLTPGRRALGVLCLVLFVLSFSVQPISIVGG